MDDHEVAEDPQEPNPVLDTLVVRDVPDNATIVVMDYNNPVEEMHDI